MEVRIGDVVRFVSEKIEGKVTGIIDNHTVNVYCEAYGFEIPAAVSDLVVIRSDFKSPEKAAGGAEKIEGAVSANTLWLAFVPEQSNCLAESRYDLYLVNDTSCTVLFSIAFYDGEHHTGIAAGNCNPDGVVAVANLSLKEMDVVKQVQVQAVFYQKGRFSLKPAIDVAVKVNPVALCKGGNYKKVRWFDGLALLRPLDKILSLQEESVEIDPQQLFGARKEKEEETPRQRPQKQVVGNLVEVDLHAGELLETTAGMESKDILEYQMGVFHQTLEEYKLRRGQKIVFIHGKGDGVLRQRIRWELQTKYKRFSHQDASFKQYGYGATMVTIK